MKRVVGILVVCLLSIILGLCCEGYREQGVSLSVGAVEQGGSAD